MYWNSASLAGWARVMPGPMASQWIMAWSQFILETTSVSVVTKTDFF